MKEDDYHYVSEEGKAFLDRAYMQAKTESMIVHQDERRTIYDWCNVEGVSCKVVYVKEAIPIGDHYHNKKKEFFFLALGIFLEMQLGDEIKYGLQAPCVVAVDEGIYHRFVCEPGSILIGVATKPFDPDDEIKKV